MDFPVYLLFHPSEQSKISFAIDQALGEGRAEVESYLVAKDKRQIPLHFKANRINLEHEPYLVGLGIEIESLKVAQEESVQKWKLLQSFADQSDTIIYIKNFEGKYVLVNQKFKTEFDLEDWQILGKSDSDLFDEPSAIKFRRDDLHAIRLNKSIEIEEYVHTIHGRKYFLTKKFPLQGIVGMEQAVCGITTDITSIKESEQRAKIQQEAIGYLATDQDLDNTNLESKLEIIARTSAETLNVDRVNIWLLERDILRCICSYSMSNSPNSMKGEILDMNRFPSYYKEVKLNRVLAISDARNDERSSELSKNYLIPNSIYSLLDASVYMSGSVSAMVCNEVTGSIRNWEPDETAFAGAVADQVARVLAIEDRKVKEKQIRESLKEKEILLAEIHHRVKNNLAVISSLLQLQALEEENEEVEQKLLDSVVRIKSMATIHEQLYQSNNFSKMDFSENIRKLISNIMDIHRPDTKVNITYNLEPILLNLNQAIPCSLIINEVFTNTLKHAFYNKEKNTILKKGEVCIELFLDSGRINLIIKDNGMGFPDDFEVAKHSSLGLVLIDVLSQQLDGEHSYSSTEAGTSFRLSFSRF
jgi:PAS domain S-box-containing protein